MTRRRLVIICALAMILAIPLGAFSVTQTQPVEAAETVIPTYGAPAYLDGSPVGGGTGYANIIDPSEAQYVVSTAAALKSALSTATSGQIVYVADGATCLLNSSTIYSSTTFVKVPAGVTLAGGRGRPGAAGGIIKVDLSLRSDTVKNCISCGVGAKVTGLTIIGPDDSTAATNQFCGIYINANNVNVSNCEIHGFGQSAVFVREASNVVVHCNYIHHCQRSVGTNLLGYGVLTQGTSGLVAPIYEGNVFDWNRHHEAAAAGTYNGRYSNFVFRYNYLGAHCVSTQIDVHGMDSSGNSVGAGGTWSIYNNTSIAVNDTDSFVGIRGIPHTMGSVYNNWTYQTLDYRCYYAPWGYWGAIGEIMVPVAGYGYNAPTGGPFVNMTVHDNWYGTTAPPSTNSAPATPGIPSGSASGEVGISYTYTVRTTDPDGDTITYTVDWGDGSSHTTSSRSSGTAAYPTHSWTQVGTYAVKVRATDSHGNVSAWSPSLSVVIGGATNSPPVTPPTPYGTGSGDAGALYWYTVSTTDPDGDTVTYTIDWGDGTSLTSGSKNSGTTAYPGHTWTQVGRYAVKVRATDSYGNVSAWSPSLSVTIGGVTNSPPAGPEAPSGPISGEVGVSYPYSVSTTDPDGDSVTYTIDWGDGTSDTTGSEESGTAAHSEHAWTEAGVYAVRVQAMDSGGESSDWSPTLTVQISNAFKPSDVFNNPPTMPATISGVTSGLTSHTYLYSTAATDPDGGALLCTFDWGDGTSTTIYQVDSGTTASAAHAWSLPGTYAVRVEVTDSEGAASGWSDTISVTILAPASREPAGTVYKDTDVDGTDPAKEQEEDSSAAPSGPAPDNADSGTDPASPDHQSVPHASASEHGSAFALWLSMLIVMVGAAVVLTGAIVRESVVKPAQACGHHGDNGQDL